MVTSVIAVSVNLGDQLLERNDLKPSEVSLFATKLFLKGLQLKMTKSIFITGAASGIGKATAISFAENGWNVGLFDINQEGLKEVAEIIGHNKCMYQKLDVTNIEDWIEAEKSFSQYTGGRCDIFFNNAGIANFAGAFEDIKIEEMNKIIDVNLSLIHI